MQRGNQRSNQGSSDQENYVIENETKLSDQQFYEVKQHQMSQNLHKNIVAIVWNQNGRMGRGSGLLISKNIVFTSAHNFYDKSQKRVNDRNIQIFVGPYGAMTRPYKIQNTFIPRQYIICPTQISIKYDYALVKLTENVNSSDFIQPKGNYNDIDGEIAIFGYPDSGYEQKKNHYSVKQLGIQRKAIQEIKHEKLEIRYNMSTAQGQSGSPIILVEGSQLYLIGIHKGNIRSKNAQGQILNVGRLLDDQLLQSMEQEILKMGGEVYQKTKKSPQDAKFWKQKAIEFYGKKDLESAINCLEKSVKIDPNYANVYICLGTIYCQISQFEKSIYCFQQSVRIKGDCQQSLFSLASVLQKANRKNEAITLYLKIINIKPNFYKSYENLGVCYLNAKQKELDAIRCFEKVISLSPNKADFFKIYCYLGQLHDRLKNTKAAVNSYQKAIHLNPSYSKPYNQLGAIYYQQFLLQEAQYWLRKAITIDPNYSQAHNNLGNIYRLQNKKQQAINSYRKALNLNPNNRTAQQNLSALINKPPSGSLSDLVT